MKKITFMAMLFVLSFKAYSDCRLPLVGDIQVAMNLRIGIDEKSGNNESKDRILYINEWT